MGGWIYVEEEVFGLTDFFSHSLADILFESSLHPIHPPGGKWYDSAYYNNQPVCVKLYLLQN